MSKIAPHGIVTVKNVSFVDVIKTTIAAGNGRYSTANFVVEAGADGIKNLADATGKITNNLGVWKQNRQIRFLFDDPALKPIGISFSQLAIPAGAPADTDGETNLPKDKTSFGRDGSRWYVEIHNHRHHKGPAADPRLCKWAFKIVVEHAAGKIGIIHPEISNTDQEPAITVPKK